MGRTAITDCVGYNKAGDKLVFTRRCFKASWLPTSASPVMPLVRHFPERAFRRDKVEAGSAAAPVETVKVDIATTFPYQTASSFQRAKQPWI